LASRADSPNWMRGDLISCFVAWTLTVLSDAVPAENVVRAGQVAWWYSLRMPPERRRRRRRCRTGRTAGMGTVGPSLRRCGQMARRQSDRAVGLGLAGVAAGMRLVAQVGWFGWPSRHAGARQVREAVVKPTGECSRWVAQRVRRCCGGRDGVVTPSASGETGMAVSPKCSIPVESGHLTNGHVFGGHSGRHEPAVGGRWEEIGRSQGGTTGSSCAQVRPTAPS
jgi:hypothetical protein